MTIPSRILFAITLAIGLSHSELVAQAQQIADSTEAADEARDRKVMERFLAVLEKTPRRGTALDRVYGYHVERGTVDAFIKNYQTKIAGDPQDGMAWLIIGLIEAQRGRDAASVDAFRKAEATRPTDSLPSFYLGQSLVLVGQPDAAIEAFERALSRKPTRADLLEIYQALGRVHQRAHRNDKAIAVWDRLEKAFPDDPRVQDQIAHSLADEGQDAAALVRFEALVKSTRDRFRQIQFAIEAAELKVRLGKSPEALADFESLLAKLDAESWLGREVRRKVEEVFLRTDDLPGLIAYYESWVKKAPDDVEAMSRLGRTLGGEGRLDEARKWLEEAVKRAPSRRELRLALIEQLIQDRKFTEAAGQYEALAKLEPNNPDVIRDWGRLLLRDISKPEPDRKQDAARVWRKLAPDDAKDAVVLAQTAELFRQAGLVDEAIGYYKRAIRLAPESTQYREYLGEYYHSLKRPIEALATWREGVDQGPKTARTLGRLGEVLAGFGYRSEALGPLTEACRLEPDDFDLRLKLADLKLDLDRPLEAIGELEKAEKSALADEQTEAVLDRLIRAYQATSVMEKTIESLRGSLARNPSASGWTRLARLLEADQKIPDAARAITEATKLDPKSVSAWVATARLRESAGDLLGSSEALRTLTKLDRRSRTDYLTGIAKLEARLGRKGPALAAGRELLAAAPGNPDHHQFFAELCFQLGEPDEGLDALRRASRSNPSDPKAMLTLAENLARQFKSEEAIELYWRAFAKSLNVEAKLSIVGRMTDQYLQRNQLDRLLARLERELREPNQQRELALCLAQVHATSGDYSTARTELERLLASNPRDPSLLSQLSSLAEQEGDLAIAAKYQKQALDLQPNPEGNSRLAQLYLDSGEISEAEAVWSKLANDAEDPSRIFSSLDRLIAHGKNETALAITERLLVKQPGNWEVLYREGVALEALGRRPEAARRFRSILELKLEDQPSVMARSKSKNTGPNPSKANHSISPNFPLEGRIASAWQIRQATKLDDNQINYNNLNTGTIWSPAEYGQARMAAIAWLKRVASREKEEDILIAGFLQARDHAAKDPRPRWDWYYLQLVQGDGPAIFEAARNLAKSLPGDPAADFAFLNSLSRRAAKAGANNFAPPNAPEPTDKTPTLSTEDIDLVLAGYRNLRTTRPELTPLSLLNVVATELKRARRDADIETIYREALASANDTSSIDAALSFAAERGRVDDFITLENKAEQLAAKQPAGVYSGAAITRAEVFGAAMNQRAGEKSYGDVLRILDDYLARIRKPEAISSRAKLRSSATATAMNPQNYQVKVGKSSRYVAIDYPEPNDYFDFDAIQVLRNVFELYKSDDVLSDLVSHLKTQSEKLSQAERIYPILAMGYLAWWNDDKEDAIESFHRGIELVPGDIELRLGLAELQARRGEAIEALELVDSVEPLDQKTVQRREVMALRLAVLTGNVNRARKASERLFGLRLDAATQMQLASQMSQLGMTDLADAVFSRVQRKTGSNQATLQALMVQYQQSGKNDQAFQIAGQILRSTANRQSANLIYQNNNRQNEDLAARAEAMAVFARSGKLKELIARAEAQLVASPGSVQALQTLAEYYQADSQPEKVKETLNRLAKLRPDDAGLRYQIGNRLFSAGNPADALEHYVAAFRKDPVAYLNRYYEIQNAFQQAGKMDDLARVVDELDVKLFAANPFIIQPIVAILEQDDKTRETGMRLFRKFWKSFPDARANLVLQLNNQSLAKSPEIYDYLREAVIPPRGKSKVDPWEGFEASQRWDNQGHIFGLISRLLDYASRLNCLDVLAADVDEAARRLPEWAGGRALKAIIQVRRGKVSEARSTLEELISKPKEIPALTRLMIGQELANVKSLTDLERRLYEGASLAENSALNFQQGPAGRIVALLHREGKDAEARQKILEYANSRISENETDDDSEIYQRVVDKMTLAQLLQQYGDSAEAVRFYEEILADSASINSVGQFSGSPDQLVVQIRQLILQILLTVTDKQLGSTLLALTPPPEGSKSGSKLVRPPVDLVMDLTIGELDKVKIYSLYAEVLRKAVALKNPEMIEPIKSVLSRRIERDPKEVSASMARCLVALAEEKPEEIRRTTASLIETLDRTPLDTIAPDDRPNGRQRAESLARIGLWLVARECLKRHNFRHEGLILQERSLEAAGRQLDNRWTLAILRESGQIAFDRGDRDKAEDFWGRMLREILNPPKSSRAKKTKLSSLPQIAVIALSVAQVVGPQMPAAPEALELLTYDRFERAVSIAKMAADHAMHDLSAKAIRGALGNGPPLMPIELNPNQNLQAIGQQNSNMVGMLASQISSSIQTLNQSWTRQKMPPKLAYETLRAIVLPEKRPSEVFLYLRPLSEGKFDKPESVGAILAGRAVEAGQVDDLRRRIADRLIHPSSSLHAEVLGIQLAIASKDEAAAIRSLRSLSERINNIPLQDLADAVCHAAIPSIEIATAESIALSLIDTVVKSVVNQPSEDQNFFGPLLISIARRKMKAGKLENAQADLALYFEKMQTEAIRVNGDYLLFWRKQLLATIAAEYARAGQLNDLWETLGRFADAPNSKDYVYTPEISGSLPKAIQLIQALPVAERYRRLREWTMPTNDRKSIRLLCDFVPEDPAIPARFGPMPHVALRGLAETSSLLIEAAREANRLDELLVEAKKADESKVENARTLLLLVQIACGNGSDCRDHLLARVGELKNPSKIIDPNSNPNSPVSQPKPIEWSDYLIAHAALSDRTLDSVSEILTNLLIEQSEKSQTGDLFLGRLRRDLALHRADRAGNLTTPLGPDPGLMHWQSSSLQAAMTHQAGTLTPLWVESQGVVSQITGPQSQFLLFNYPLTGNFEINAETYIGDHSESQVSYGGLIFQPSGGGTLFPVGHHEFRAASDHFALRNLMNRMTIEVRTDKLRMLVNGHLFHEEAGETSISPWLAFYSEADQQTACRDVTITGSPQIPREVPLLRGDHLEGWACGFYNETQPNRRNVDQVETSLLSDPTISELFGYNSFDWRAVEGTIIGQRILTPTPGQTVPQSRIYYYRPILDGESISYEFLYEPGETIAHPTLERLAFLLEPDGVKLHWLTDLEEDVTGLDADNSFDFAEFRRGSGPLPLKAGEWNRTSVRYSGGNVLIYLNDIQIYEYPLEPANQRIFGFFHDKYKTQAKIREIILRGNWPTTLPADLLARKLPDPTAEDRRARGAMIENKFIVGDIRSTLSKARRLPPDRRYTFLREYVLPTPDHDDFRIEGELRPTELSAVAPNGISDRPMLDVPALELLSTAKEIGNLTELTASIERSETKSTEAERAKLALKTLVNLARGNDQEAEKSLRELHERATKLSDDVKSSHWPELLAASAGIERPTLRDSSRKLVDLLDQQSKQHASTDWAKVFQPILARIFLPSDAVLRTKGWDCVSHADASSHGLGLPMPIWTFDSGVWSHRSGHRLDHLYFDTPLRGNFTVECELSPSSRREAQLSYAATSIALEIDLKKIQVRHFGQVETTSIIDPPLKDVGEWYAFKLVVADGIYSTWINGRKIHESRLAEEPDPWLSVVSQGNANGTVRNLKISGDPVIPASLTISAGPGLEGWLGNYYDDSYLWSKQGDEIVGMKLRRPTEPIDNTNGIFDVKTVGVAGSKQESVLKYNRPMLEDGEICYEFYHQPGKVMVHPALDRLTFLIEPDGVKIHTMTDAQFDRTGLRAENIKIEDDRRRGPANPPLILDAWNRLKLRMSGDNVSLILNDVTIYERPLEKDNRRDFGLFHYADETEARVRNVHYEGQWPRSFPR